MKNSELYQLALRCLISDEIPGFDEDFKNNIAVNDEILHRFIHLCSNHLVLPAIYNRFIESGLTDVIPNELNEHLKEIYTLNINRNKEILKQIDEINQKFHQADIEPVYLKGAANLLDNLYSNIADRMMGDIDILVKNDDFLEAADLLFNLGYKNELKIYDDIYTLKDYPRMYRNDVPADIELHRLPVIPKFAKEFNTVSIFKEKKQILSKINCFVPSDKHKTIHNFIHGQLTNKGHAIKLIPLRDLYDSYLLLKRVNLNDVLNEIKERKKARLYFEFIPALINIKTITPDYSKKNKDFFIKQNWYLNHPRIHFILINTYKFMYLFNDRFLKAFTDKSTMKNIYVRVKDKEWWQKRLSRGLKEYFD